MFFRNKTNGDVIEAEESQIALFRTQPHLQELTDYQPKNDDEKISDSSASVASGGKRKRSG